MTRPDVFPHHPELAERFDPHHSPVLMLCRVAGQAPEHRQMVAGELHRSATALASHGLDARPHLPSRAVIDDLLSLAEQARPSVEIDLRDQCGVYCVLAGGEDWSHMATSLIRALQPSLVFAHRIDRLARRAWDLGGIALAQEGRWLGDAGRIRPAASIENLMAFYGRVAETTTGEERRRMQERVRLGKQNRREV